MFPLKGCVLCVCMQHLTLHKQGLATVPGLLCTMVLDTPLAVVSEDFCIFHRFNTYFFKCCNSTPVSVAWVGLFRIDQELCFKIMLYYNPPTHIPSVKPSGISYCGTKLVLSVCASVQLLI